MNQKFTRFPSSRSFPLKRSASQVREAAAFTLVEVVLAIGLVAFVFIAIIGALPMGLGIFRQAMDTSISAQITQHIVSDAQQSDFNSLFLGLTPQNGFYAMPQRYFDDQGSEVQAGAPTALYTVWVRASQPGDPDPNSNQSGNFTTLPAAPGQAPFHPRAMTILAVQIVSNPAHRPLSSFVNADTQLIDAAKAKTNGLSVQTLSVAVTRNGSN